jgi:hypothetical protein
MSQYSSSVDFGSYCKAPSMTYSSYNNSDSNDYNSNYSSGYTNYSNNSYNSYSSNISCGGIVNSLCSARQILPYIPVITPPK